MANAVLDGVDGIMLGAETLRGGCVCCCGLPQRVPSVEWRGGAAAMQHTARHVEVQALSPMHARAAIPILRIRSP